MGEAMRHVVMRVASARPCAHELQLLKQRQRRCQSLLTGLVSDWYEGSSLRESLPTQCLRARCRLLAGKLCVAATQPDAHATHPGNSC